MTVSVKGTPARDRRDPENGRGQECGIRPLVSAPSGSWVTTVPDTEGGRDRTRKRTPTRSRSEEGELRDGLGARRKTSFAVVVEGARDRKGGGRTGS